MSRFMQRNPCPRSFPAFSLLDSDLHLGISPLRVKHAPLFLRPLFIVAGQTALALPLGQSGGSKQHHPSTSPQRKRLGQTCEFSTRHFFSPGSPSVLDRTVLDGSWLDDNKTGLACAATAGRTAKVAVAVRLTGIHGTRTGSQWLQTLACSSLRW